MDGITSLLNQSSGRNPVEQMSNDNAIGANTGYPMAYMNTPAYAVARNTPQPQDVIHGGQDANIDPYTGQEKFGGGGIVALNGAEGSVANTTGDFSSQGILDFLLGRSSQQPRYSQMRTAPVVGSQMYDQSGKALPRYQINPDGTISLAGAQEAAQQALGPTVRPSSGYGSANYYNNPENRLPLPKTPAGVEKPWNEWTAEEKAQWAQENPNMAAFDTAVHGVVDPVAAFVGEGGFTGAVGRGLSSLLGSGVGTSVNERNPAAISAYNQQPGIGTFFKNLFSGTTGNNAPIEDRSGTTANPPGVRVEGPGPGTASTYAYQTPESRAIAAIQASNVNAGEGSWGGEGGGESSGSKAGGLLHEMAQGGLSSLHYNLGSYSDGGRLLKGPGDGVSDDIPATIGAAQPARLADGEFVVPARIVSELGNGSTDAGARKLYAMMDRIQSARKQTVGKGKAFAKDTKADKHLPK